MANPRFCAAVLTKTMALQAALESARDAVCAALALEPQQVTIRLQRSQNGDVRAAAEVCGPLHLDAAQLQRQADMLMHEQAAEVNAALEGVAQRRQWA